MAFSRSNVPTYASFSDLVGNGRTFVVPPFQRDYTWKSDNWEELWTDIIEVAAAADGEHFLGAIVIRQSGNQAAEIVDGQQRIATLSLVVLAAVSLLEESGLTDSADRERAVDLRALYLSTKDPQSLTHRSKLSLNRADNDFYQHNLIQLRPPLAPSRLPESHDLLWKAFLFFKRQLAERYALPGAGGDLSLFVQTVVGARLFFLRIPVEDDLAAYTVFETFNARGVELTASDLLKNYLMAKVARLGRADLDRVLSLWERIVKAVNPKNLPEFLRHYLNSMQKPYVRQERLFKTVRDKVSSPEGVFDLLTSLEASAIWYQALTDETDAIWNGNLRAQQAVSELRLFGVKQYRPLVLAAARRFDLESLASILRFCSVISFRYNIIADKNTNELEKIYNDVAADIHGGKLTSVAEVREALRRIGVSDDEFRDAFSRKVIPALGKGKKLVRYILVQLERQLGNMSISENTRGLTIEHVLPENLTAEWQQSFSTEQHERFVSRLGNYTLLTSSQNNDVAQLAITAKALVFATSGFKLTERLVECDEWEPKAIESRQREMAAWASSIWSL